MFMNSPLYAQGLQLYNVRGLDSLSVTLPGLFKNKPILKTMDTIINNIYDCADMRNLKTCKQYFWTILWEIVDISSQK
jgi:hypothetical protein